MKKSTIFGLTLLAIILTTGGGVLYNNHLISVARTTQTKIEKELADIEDLEKRQETTKEEIAQLTLDLKEAEINHALTTNSDPRINAQVLTDHNKSIDDMVNILFNWKNGEEYDKAREYIINRANEGNEFVNKYFKENVKVDIPDGYDVANNEVDLMGVKSKLKTYHTVATDLNDPMTYEVLVEFQIYEEDKELNRKEPQTERVNLTLTLDADSNIVNLDGFDLYHP